MTFNHSLKRLLTKKSYTKKAQKIKALSGCLQIRPTSKTDLETNLDLTLRKGIIYCEMC
jgi:hypothetical protein